MNSSIEFANIALLIGIGVVVIASVQWQAGVIASIVAAFGLNYFGVEPIHSLRITSRDDIVTIVLLMTLGLTVSALTAYRLRSVILHSHNSKSEKLQHGAQPDLTGAVRASAVWSELQARVAHELDLITVQLVSDSPQGLPQISGHLGVLSDTSNTVVVPATGAVVPFTDPRISQKLVITPIEGAGPVTLRRDVLLMFARHLEAHSAGILTA